MLFYGFMKLVAPGIHGCIYASLVFLVCWTLAFIIAAATADFPAGLSAGLLPAGFLAGFQLVLSLFMPFSWSSLGVLSIKVLLCCCGFDGLFFLMALFLLAAGASGSCSTLHWFKGALWFCSTDFQLDFQLGFQQPLAYLKKVSFLINSYTFNGFSIGGEFRLCIALVYFSAFFGITLITQLLYEFKRASANHFIEE
ncbi:unnamed protein product [Ilex paraguariensis]|uniref:ATP synthase F0 subunit 6 n=1 Tax=Ilex paraguariensis TaxID=185542 RepID=A0ABC8V149_9AQUA